MGAAFSLDGGSSPLVAVAVHAGHELRRDVAEVIAIDEATRRREEDPGTDRLTSIAATRVTVHRSRFEVDLNRPRDRAVYARPEDAWGLQLWRGSLPAEVAAASIEIYDAFYTALAECLDAVAEGGRFVVLDLHSYNHRRAGVHAPPEPEDDNPEVNVGTGSVDRDRWASLIDRFVTDLAEQEVDGHRLDVRENVRFRGGHLAWWVNDRYPDRGCALAIELKKTFMDEWSGEIDDVHLEALRRALSATTPGLLDELGAVRR